MGCALRAKSAICLVLECLEMSFKMQAFWCQYLKSRFQS